MKIKKDKYGREIRVVTISGKQYQILPEVRMPTKAIRNLSGRFMGRYSGVRDPDQTKFVRILKEIDVNKDKIPDLRPGQIVGRISRYYRGPMPKSLKVKVHVSNKRSAAAMRRAQQDKFRKIKRRK